jgi:cytidine deaminase
MPLSCLAVSPWVSPVDSETSVLALLQQAQQAAIAPVSQFQVSAVALGVSGQAYLGYNIEFENQPIQQTLHAEQHAIALAKVSGEAQLESLWVTALPCGHCRQFLLELGMPDLTIHVVSDVQDQSFSLAQLLPEPFTWADPDSGLLTASEGTFTLAEETTDPLVYAALEALQASYAPYTQCHAGVAIATAEDLILSGSMLESAAFNPTVNPFQVAYAHLLASGLSAHDIVAVSLVERSDARLSVAPTTWSLVRTLAPLAKVSYHTAKPVL